MAQAEWNKEKMEITNLVGLSLSNSTIKFWQADITYLGMDTPDENSSDGL